MVDSMHQSWLPRVVEAAFPRDGAKEPFALLQRRQPRATTAARYLTLSLPCTRCGRLRTAPSCFPSVSETPRPQSGLVCSGVAGALQVSWLDQGCCPITRSPFSISCPQMPLQKLLFSATLTQNPEKLQQLGLYQPRLFSTGLTYKGPRDTDEDGDSGGKYTFPAGLSVSGACRGGEGVPQALGAWPTLCCPHSTTTCPAASALSHWPSCI